MNTKKFYMSKTVIFNVIILGVALAGLFGFADYVPSDADQESINAIVAMVAAAIPVLNLILRFFTDTKITL